MPGKLLIVVVGPGVPRLRAEKCPIVGEELELVSLVDAYLEHLAADPPVRPSIDDHSPIIEKVNHVSVG